MSTTKSTESAIKGNTYLYLTVFTSGMATLAIELSASRLLGSVFGTSNIVWANVIGLILLYLTIGYFVGGRWADRSPHYSTLYKIIIWGAFLSAIIPLVARPVLRLAADSVVDAEAGLAIGSFVSIMVLFSVPITLLGCVSPFAIRLAIQTPETAGRISGQIYAISNVGSLIGTFTPVLFLIPELGTYQTFLLFAGLLYTVGFIGLWRHTGIKAFMWLWMPLVVGLITIWALDGPLRSPLEGQELLFEDESAYNYIQVQENQEGYRYLYLNEGQGVHSIWHPTDFLYNGTWDYFLTAPYFNTPPYRPDNLQSALVIGLAAGTIPRQYIEVYGDIPIDGVEIDGGIVEAAEQYFDMNSTYMPSLDVHVEDGRYVLRQLDERYSVIAIDAYRPPYIPWHLTTVEFFQEVQEHLLPNGVVAINVGRTNSDRRLVDAMTNTLSEVFPVVHAVDVPSSFNTILYATQQPTNVENLQVNINGLPEDSHPALRSVLNSSLQNLVPSVRSDILFTDNRAPLETLVDSLVLDFLVNGDVNQIR